MTTSLYPKIQVYFGENAINIEKNPKKVLQNDASLKKAYEILHGQATALIDQNNKLWGDNIKLQEQVKNLTAELGKEKSERSVEQTNLRTELTNKEGIINHWKGIYTNGQKFQNDFITLLGENLKGGVGSKINKIPLLQDLLVKTRNPDGSYATYWSLKDLVEEVDVLRKGQKGILDKLGVADVHQIDIALTYVSDDLVHDTKSVYKLADLAKSRNNFRVFAKAISTKLHKDDFVSILAEIDLMMTLKAQFDTLKIALNTVVAVLRIMDNNFKEKEVKIIQTKKGIIGGLSRKSIKLDVQNQFLQIENVIKVGLGKDWDDETSGTTI